MKKLLALVLALVMVLSLCVVSSNAANFTDAKDVTYTEAADVMKAIKVIDGFTDGSFQPKALLTRAQAAKIICNLILGPTTADALAANSAPFADVPASHWAAGYIAYCASEGIINGVGDNKFDPEGNLTGYAFMKMLLGALGYDAKAEGYTGANWSIQVAKRALNIGLDDGLDGSFAGNAAVTREEACLFALNTLKATMVEYDETSTVTVPTASGDIVFSNSSKAKEVSRSNGKDYRGENETYGSGTLQFCEKYFKDLTLDEDANNAQYKRPSHQWKNDGDSIGKYADKPVLVYTTNAAGRDIADDIDEAGYKVASTGTVVFNNVVSGSEDTYKWSDFKTDLTRTKGSATVLTGKGIVVELYADVAADSDDEIDYVVVKEGWLAKVTSVVKDKASTKSVDERKLTLTELDETLTFNAYADKDAYSTIDTVGFDKVFEAVEEDDYVIVFPQGNTDDWDGTTGNAYEIALPETVEGAMTYKNGDADKIKVGGETYEKAIYGEPITADVDADEDVTVYLDANGYVLFVDGNKSADDKSVVVLKKYSAMNKDGEIVDMIKGITSDGEIVNWEYDKNAVTGKTGVAYGTLNKNAIYTYDEDDDAYALFDDIVSRTASAEVAETEEGKVYAVTLPANTELKSSAKKVTLNGAYAGYFADGVKFIFVDDGKAVVKEGVQKVFDKNNATNLYAVINGDGEVSTLYVMKKASNSVSTSDKLIYVAESTGTVRGYDADGDKTTYYTYDAYIDGELVEDFMATTSESVGFYEYEIEDETGAYVLDGNAYTWSSGDDLQTYTATLAASSTAWHKDSKLLKIASQDLELAGSTVYADNTDNEITSFAELKDVVEVEGTALNVAVLYDDDAGVVLFVYITD